jgi:hypothetical protein
MQKYEVRWQFLTLPHLLNGSTILTLVINIRKAANSSLYICAGMKGSGLAVGDSGGAVLVNKAGRYYAVGIASQTGAIASSVVTAENIRRDINPGGIYGRLLLTSCRDLLMVV